MDVRSSYGRIGHVTNDYSKCDEVAVILEVLIGVIYDTMFLKSSHKLDPKSTDCLESGTFVDRCSGNISKAPLTWCLGFAGSCLIVFISWYVTDGDEQGEFITLAMDGSLRQFKH